MIHGDLSSNNSNVAAGNSLISSGLKFETINFKDKYIADVCGFTTAGLWSNLIFSGTTFKKEGNMKQRNYMFIGTKQIDGSRTISRLNIWYMLFA